MALALLYSGESYERGAITFDQPPPGQSVEAFITEHFRVNALALANLYEVGSAVINKVLLQHPCASDRAS